MYLKKIKGLSPKEIVVKIKKKTFTTISKEIKCFQDNLYPSYSKKIYKYELENIFLDPIEYEFTDFEIKQIKETTSLYLKHYFD
ncbi:hypothetical protein ABWK52_28025, partial [Bacillus sp. AP50]